MVDALRREYFNTCRTDDRRLPDIKPEIVRRAQLTVADRARDIEDAATLLSMLGIHPVDWPRSEAEIVE